MGAKKKTYEANNVQKYMYEDRLFHWFCNVHVGSTDASTMATIFLSVFCIDFSLYASGNGDAASKI